MRRLEDGRIEETLAEACDNYILGYLPELNTTVEANGRPVKFDAQSGVVLERLDGGTVVEYWPQRLKAEYLELGVEEDEVAVKKVPPDLQAIRDARLENSGELEELPDLDDALETS